MGYRLNPGIKHDQSIGMRFAEYVAGIGIMLWWYYKLVLDLINTSEVL